MADAIYWQILEKVQDVIQSVTYSPQGTDPTSALDTTKAVVIRKYRTPRPESQSLPDEIKPGFIITPGPVTPDTGTNVRDGKRYNILVQLIAKDYDGRITNFRSYLKWLEQADKALSHYFASNCDICGTSGCVHDSSVGTVFVVDEKKYAAHQNFVGGVEVIVEAELTRGVET